MLLYFHNASLFIDFILAYHSLMVLPQGHYKIIMTAVCFQGLCSLFYLQPGRRRSIVRGYSSILVRMISFEVKQTKRKWELCKFDALY